MDIRVKRVYDPVDPSDGLRLLVDRLWPRGLSKASLKLDEWLKEISPSHELRRRFKHEPSQWPEFQKLYFKELDLQPERIEELLQKARLGRITLLFAAREREYNNAMALKNYLEKKARGSH